MTGEAVPGLAAARLWAASRFPYLASALFGSEVTVAPGIGTVAIDDRWRLRADPGLVADWTPAELGSMLVHHVCHLLRSHADRAVASGVSSAARREWIRAADAEINDDLIPAGIELPGRPVRPRDFGAADGRLAEEYFTLIRRDAADQAGQAQAGQAQAGQAPGADAGGADAGGADAGGADAHGPGSARENSASRHGARGHQTRAGSGPGTSQPGALGGEDEATRARDARSGEWFDCGSGADGQPRAWDGGDGGLDPWQADLLCRQVARDVIRHGKEAGTVPGGLLRWAAEVLAPRVDWRRLLAAELRRAIADVAGAVDYSYRRPSRRAAAVRDVVLPALRRPLPEVAVVCDTSGSMSEYLLAAALAEVEGLLRSLGLARQLRVLACDAAAGPAQRVTSARQVRLTGGGGTNMGAGIAAAAGLRPRPAVTVVLTDGYTPWPAVAPKGMRVVAGLLGAHAPGAPDWARSVRVPDAQPWLTPGAR